MSRPERHLVLVHPEVHWNTGNIGRTCLGAGATLHLIQPLGFSLEAKEVKRAGLDYWHRVRLRVWNALDALFTDYSVEPSEIVVLSKTGGKPFWQMPRPDRLFLLFGSETQGLPEQVMRQYRHQRFHIPIANDIRSLNLSTAAGIVLYESLRNTGMAHEWPDPKGSGAETSPDA